MRKAVRRTEPEPALLLAAIVSDSAGWHRARDSVVPPNISLIPLSPCARKLNPVKCIWLHLRERQLSHCLLDD